MFRPLSAAIAAAALLSACGGGGGSSAPVPVAPAPPSPPGISTSSAQRLALTFTGTQTLSRVRTTKALAGTPVVVRFNGATVGIGTLDANGHAVVTFSSAVPAGSTVAVTAGSVTVNVTIAVSVPATAVAVSVNPDGTVNVISAADPNGTGVVTADEPEQENDVEDHDGNVMSVTAGSSNVLPANAPFTLTNACGVLTLKPAGAAASLKFEEKGSDGEDDGAGRVRFEGAFTGTLQFPVVSSAARIHLEVFNAQGQRLIEVKAPITAVSSGATAGGPCPSASPNPSAPSASPSATPSPSPTATAH